MIMNKKGSLVLRDMVFMMMIVSSIFIFAGLFVSEMALNYENTNMSDEWGLTETNDLANATFYNTGQNISVVGEDLGEKPTGLLSLLKGAGQVLDGIGAGIFMILTAPNTIGSLVHGILVDIGTGRIFADTVKFLIVGILWGIVVFSIISGFLRGPKL